jgi:hypothetical protein
MFGPLVTLFDKGISRGEVPSMGTWSWIHRLPQHCKSDLQAAQERQFEGIQISQLRPHLKDTCTHT